MADLVILTEAGGSAGFGHLMRCLAIANETDAELYVNADGDYPDNNRSKKYNWRTNLDKLISELPASCSILVDSYLADSHIYKLLSTHFEYVSVIDDYNRLVYPVDIIINPGIKLPDYRNQTAKVVGGNKYIILRKEIIQQQKKSDYQKYSNLLITFGGCDTSNIFEWLLPLIHEYSFNSITIVAGNNRICSLLSKKFNRSSIKWLGQVDALYMANLMYDADICISAGGQTLHELAYIGVPTICIETGEDQKNNIEGYIDAGFLQGNLSIETDGLNQRVSYFLNMYKNLEVRKGATLSGKSMVDGRGCMRIEEVIYNLAS
jgi:UDP-2,4-diacetamido-2,4,6-trideoxy-beta-L-altropyranose hydrolase